MFNKGFNKLVAEHPERFEYDFELPKTTRNPKAETKIFDEVEKRAIEARKKLALRKSGA